MEPSMSSRRQQLLLVPGLPVLINPERKGASAGGGLESNKKSGVIVSGSTVELSSPRQGLARGGRPDIRPAPANSRRDSHNGWRIQAAVWRRGPRSDRHH